MIGKPGHEWIEPSLFARRAYKRKPLAGENYSGHLWKASGEVLGLVEARKRIYVPAYYWMLEHKISKVTVEWFLARASRGEVSIFYDISRVGKIDDISGSLAHAALVANWLLGKWQKAN